METVRALSWSGASGEIERLVTREWLVTNGLGGYASGTVCGVLTRRYHGLLIAALPSPLGRTVMVNRLSELVRLPDGSLFRLGAEERSEGTVEAPGARHLVEFRLDRGLPTWRYRLGATFIEKTLFLPHRQNTVHVLYRLAEGGSGVRLKLQPAFHLRSHDARVDAPLREKHIVTASEGRLEISAGSDFPPLRMVLHGDRSAFTVEWGRFPDVHYRVEKHRGYESAGELWTPGYFRVDLAPGRDAALVASTEPWEVILALPTGDALAAEMERRSRLIAVAPEVARSGPAAELVLAADQFIIVPTGRVEDAARAHAAGDEIRTVIAGYHWFTDWGRDTMISLEGLAIATGRRVEAGYILRTFGHYVRDGLIPNMFPEGRKEALYNTADATLWFFHAIDRYLAATGDRATLRFLLPQLVEIVERHVGGTRFGIRVDPADGLLIQGEEGCQLTWMDAKVGDWVVTPRRGKAVEINALWHEALMLLAGWLAEERGEGEARPILDRARRARESFNRRFWYPAGGYLYDVVDGEKGDDPACRPNQIFAIALRHPVLDPARWAPVVGVVERDLLTPVGLRSLARSHPDYEPRYDGDVRARDAAYHQGTVWAWLIGPFIDAWLKVHPGERERARGFLSGLLAHLDDACIGSISEVFDAEEPFCPRGCVAQAWSVAEVLRAWVKLGTDPRAGRRDEVRPSRFEDS